MLNIINKYNKVMNKDYNLKYHLIKEIWFNNKGKWKGKIHEIKDIHNSRYFCVSLISVFILV